MKRRATSATPATSADVVAVGARADELAIVELELAGRPLDDAPAPLGGDELDRQSEILWSDQPAPNTVRVYASRWAAFLAFCAEEGAEGLPASPRTIRRYLAHLYLEGLGLSAIDGALAAICKAHELTRHASPRAYDGVREIRRAIAKRLGVRPHREAAPLLVEPLRAFVATCDDGARGRRDRALLLVGFSTGARRAELADLRCEDLSWRGEPPPGAGSPDPPHDEGVAVTIARSKTDQMGRGRVVGVTHGDFPETDPVLALRVWLETLEQLAPLALDARARVFRGIEGRARVGHALSPDQIARIIKRRAALAGYDPRIFSGHSFRAGLITAAARAGKADRIIMGTTGHSSAQMMQRYVRAARLFEDTASRGLGL